MYEVSPDYGMFSQAWNIYSFGVPIVSQFFGVQPNAEKREIIITPQMPTQWEAASVENIRVAETVISIKYRKHKNGFSIHVESSNPRWRITPVPRPDYQIEIKPNGNNNRTTDVDFVLQ
jgi:cellobiose phosphorylase